MRRRTLLAALAAAGASAPALVRADPALFPLHLGVTPNDDMISVVYAKQTGMFERAGLDVTIEKAQNGAAIAAAVASGAYEIGKSSTTPLFDAHVHGVPFVLIAPAAIYESTAPYGGIVTPVPLKDGRDLNGKTIGTGTSNDIGTLGIKAWMDKTGGDLTTIRHLEIPISAVPAAIAQHRIDGGEMVYPPLARALAGGGLYLTPTLTAIAPTFVLSAWFTTTDFSSKHPEVVKAFARVVAEAATYTNAHHAETVQLLADFTGVPVDVIAHMTRVRNGTTLAVAQLQPVIDASVKYGDLKASFPAAELIDPLVAGPKDR
jgi:ABC-type nitrate/sulfonate/bicarbonate transport system substrate-binding protein